MTSWIKYLFIGLIFLCGTLFVANVGLRHNSNVTTTQEVELALKSSQVGELRENATNVSDKEALVANLIMEIASTEKEQGKDMKIDYVFLDHNGNPTQQDNNIESVQFRVKILDDDGEVISTSTQRVSLSKYE